MAITTVAIMRVAEAAHLDPGNDLRHHPQRQRAQQPAYDECARMHRGLRPEIMISHGNVVCRNLRLCLSGLEAGLLSGQAAGQAVSEALRRAAELRGDQLHVPAPALGRHAEELGGSHAARLRVRGEGQHAHHAHPAAEERRRSHRAVSEDDRSAAHGAPAGADLFQLPPP